MHEVCQRVTDFGAMAWLAAVSFPMRYGQDPQGIGKDSKDVSIDRWTSDLDYDLPLLKISLTTGFAFVFRPALQEPLEFVGSLDSFHDFLNEFWCVNELFERR